MKMKRPSLILASASPRRLDLLAPHFRLVIAPGAIDEDPSPRENPLHYVRRMAIEKWQASPGRSLVSTRVMVAADTTVICKKRILGKPASRTEAKKMLMQLSGVTHSVVTAVAVGRASDSRPREVFRVVTDVRFRKLTKIELNRYLASGEWRGKAGSYGIQGQAASLIDSINGSLTNVIGLPLEETLQSIARCSTRRL
jgi:septum formation protein